jgi:hypothetical protein
MDTYRITLTGESPLLMHADDILWRDTLAEWLAVPENKQLSKPGDDRTPAWTWIGRCYHDDEYMGIASDQLMSALREGGAKVPAGKGKLTFKRQTQSGLVVNEVLWPIVTTRGMVPWPEVAKLIDEKSFAKHEEVARSLGFELFVKNAAVGQSKHVRVRARFNRWEASGTITVFDETLTQKTMQLILDMAGSACGLGDWRPSSPRRPGPWGKFTAAMKKL